MNLKQTIFFFFILSLVALGCSSNKFRGENPPPNHEIWDGLLQKHVSDQGDVNYKSFIKDTVLLNSYLQLLSQNEPNTKSWSDNDQKAYWINAYNAFTVKLITMHYPIKSIKDIGPENQIPFVNTPWDIKFIKIGESMLDLNNIEHGQLRKPFKDARIHFAVNCASISCPILHNRAFKGEILEQQLDEQAKKFLYDESKNQIGGSQIKISSIFKWYKIDFTKKGSLIEYLNKYADPDLSKSAPIEYLDYNWNLNEQS